MPAARKWLRTDSIGRVPYPNRVSENEFAGSGRTLAEIGEFGLIEQVARPARQGPAVLLGPGDDAAVIAAPDRRVVASTDLLVEGRHFRRDWSGGREIGRKAAAQNLADIIAMGARPTALLVGLSAPGDVTVGWAADLAAGLAEESALVGASVAGGDTTGGERIVIAVTALGSLEGRAPVLRSGAHPGDVVAVAGELGWSAAGLELLTRGVTGPDDAVHGKSAGGDSMQISSAADPVRPGPDHPASADGSLPGPGKADRPGPDHRPSAEAPPEDGESGRSADDPLAPWRAKALARHRSPEPPYPAGPAAALAGATAMLDVSDGLLADLGHIAKESWVAIDLDPALFPIPDGLRGLAKDCGLDPMHWFLTGGEDHALAGCFPADRPLPPDWHRIGRVTAPAAQADLRVTVSGAPWPGRQGWDHFADPG